MFKRNVQTLRSQKHPSLLEQNGNEKQEAPKNGKHQQAGHHFRFRPLPSRTPSSVFLDKRLFLVKPFKHKANYKENDVLSSKKCYLVKSKSLLILPTRALV